MRSDYLVAALFGCITVAMNLTFYVAIDHLPLGSGVAIEFIGPISVAAVATRTRRNAGAVVLATAGVVLLSGTEVGSSAVGLVFILVAAVLWAGYIVLGGRIARRAHGLGGLSFGLLVGLILSSPVGLVDVGKVVRSPAVLFGGLLVGLLSSAIPYGIDQTVLRTISVRRFAVLQALLPVVATLIGYVALGQHPSALEAVGIFLVVGGVAAQDRS
jgi:inner membrane transporter RhtA